MVAGAPCDQVSRGSSVKLVHQIRAKPGVRGRYLRAVSWSGQPTLRTCRRGGMDQSELTLPPITPTVVSEVKRALAKHGHPTSKSIMTPRMRTSRKQSGSTQKERRRSSGRTSTAAGSGRWIPMREGSGGLTRIRSDLTGARRAPSRRLWKGPSCTRAAPGDNTPSIAPPIHPRCLGPHAVDPGMPAALPPGRQGQGRLINPSTPTPGRSPWGCAVSGG